MGVRRQGQEPPGVAGRFQTLIDLQDVYGCGELRGAAGRFQALPGLLDVFFYEDQMVRADNLAGQQADPLDMPLCMLRPVAALSRRRRGLEE